MRENYVEVANSHQLLQFKSKPKLMVLYQALFEPFSHCLNALEQILQERHLSNAEGKQLDGIGSILGVERPFTIADGLYYFGFTGQTKALGFSQAIIRSESLSTGQNTYTYMTDRLYIRLLKWKIIANNSHGTTEDIIKACQAAFKATKVEVIEKQCEITVNITRNRKDISEAIDSIKEQLIPAIAGIFVSVNFINK